MNKMGTIIGFTFKNKVRTKSFLITTLILVILLSIGMNIPYLIKVFQGDDSNGSGLSIGVVAENGSHAVQLLQTYAQQSDTGAKITVYPSADDAGLKKAMQDGQTDGYLTFTEQGGAGLSSPVYHSSGSGSKAQSFLQTALQQINAQLIAGDKLTAEQIAAMNAPISLGMEKINANGGEAADGSHPIINYVLVYCLLILFFMSIMMTGNMISAEVTSEKSSRIMEILITSAAPLAQMFGKVIGIFLVGLIQIVIIAAAVAANLLLPHNADVLKDFNLDLGQLSVSLLVYGLILYILGYFLYALMYAAVGSIVSRTEDLGQAVMPIMMLGFVNFYVPLFSISAPNTMLVKVASYVPFTSPLSMLLRIGVGDVAFWEIAVSLLILLVTCFGMGWLAAKIYRTGVLMYGKRPSIKELRKAMKAYKI
ncbi:ABC transporter permease [Paenibacillus sp. HN-1]|uniref:ABC transporter permease n=1 Tax=Paenibacillus TaxID=44249 RepID=UPI001CA80669|nr:MULTISPECIES: ABC transporter permease [Paenibacillus]MBY9079947.1 ABC transporter permease [Paenibacillus sp. CGMCC 1.18879]MBY9084589.1 ABC transporter permease [Paenibacillus sinensis]